MGKGTALAPSSTPRTASEVGSRLGCGDFAPCGEDLEPQRVVARAPRDKTEGTGRHRTVGTADERGGSSTRLFGKRWEGPAMEAMAERSQL